MNIIMRSRGSSIDPAFVAMYMQIDNLLQTSLELCVPFLELHLSDMIFLTYAIIAVASIALAIVLRKRVTAMSIPNLN